MPTRHLRRWTFTHPAQFAKQLFFQIIPQSSIEVEKYVKLSEKYSFHKICYNDKNQTTKGDGHAALQTTQFY